MVLEELEFTILNEGKEVECTILSLIPKNNNESYMVFTDGDKDDNDNIIFKYGLLKKVEEDYELEPGVSLEELDYIKDKFYEDLVELAKSLNGVI